MNFRARFYKAALLGLAALLFWGSSQMQARLNADRTKYGFTRLPALSNAPPLLAFTTVALGGFRGLISNALWIRATELQDQDRFFEMVQLADWITTLEPHYSEVWRMLAWNMAYNISVKCKDFKDRWQWVQRGIALLHKGLEYNPNDPKIYQDLSWIFRHKIGQNLDDAHRYYKIQWARQMQDVLGGHPDFPALLNPKTPEERERVKKLREVYFMDPAFIQHIDKTYGPLDWRLPDAHAIYWAEMGVRDGTQQDKDLVRRFAYAIMQQVCRRGGALPSWVTNVTDENFILWPDLDLVPKVNASYERTAQELPNLKTIVQNAQKNFLKEAVVLLYEYNRDREASEWFNYLKANFTNALIGSETNLTVEEYAFNQIQSEIGELDHDKVTDVILGLLSQQYLCLIGEDEGRAANFSRLAQAIWQNYMNRLPGGIQDPNGKRIALEPMAQLRRYELEQMEGYLSPQHANYLRLKLQLPPRTPAAPPTQTPPPNASPPAGAERT
ncbi:MAG TPA: hypothetical protein VN765_15220 [Candidatus Acidoferrum sp.]|nr:hypothetical protein [Candidatus Acidoferrum sp.]